MGHEPECVVCLQAYDEGDHVPRVLSCGHSVCGSCASDLPSHWGAGSSREQPGGAVIRCPECKRRTRLPLGGDSELPRNFELMRVIQSLHHSVSAKTGTLQEVKRPAAIREWQKLDIGKQHKGPKEEGTCGVLCSPIRPPKERNGKFTVWIIPQSALELKDESKHGLSIGVMCCDNRGVRKTQEVTLHPCSHLKSGELVLATNEELSYEQLVEAAWEKLEGEARFELLELLSLSCQCDHVSKILGIWMSEKGSIFLVDKVHVEGLERACSAFVVGETGSQRGPGKAPAIGIEEVKCGKVCAASAATSIVENAQVQEHAPGLSEVQSIEPAHCSSSLDFTATEESPEATGGERGLCYAEMDVDNVVGNSVGRIARLGVELCEILMEIHAEGLVVGILRPECLMLDQFGHLQLHISSALNLRQKIQKETQNCRMKHLKSDLNNSATGLSPKTEETTFDNVWTDVLDRLGLYLSPEVLYFLLEKGVDRKSLLKIQSSAASDGDNMKNVITYKADLWSLGCLLLQLFSATALIGGLKFSEAYHRIVKEGCTSEMWKEGGLPLAGQQGQLLEQLIKCLTYEQDERPEVGEIWCSLRALVGDCRLSWSTQHKDYLEKDVWVLGVAGLTERRANPMYDDLNFPKKKDEDNTTHSKQVTPISIHAVENAAVAGQEGAGSVEPLIQGGSSVVEVTLQGHLDTVTSLAICGDYLISASFDKTVRVWSQKDDKPLQVLEGHVQRITALAVDEASSIYASGDYGGQICVWKLTSSRVSAPVATWQEHSDWRYSGVASMVASSDGVLYSGSGDRTIKAWSLKDFQHLATMEGHKGVVSSLLLEGDILYSGSWDGSIRLWWRSDHTVLADLGGASSVALGPVRALAWSATTGLLFAARDTGCIQVWKDEECVGLVEAHKGVVATLVVDGAWLYSGSWDRSIKAWRVEEVLSNSTSIERTCISPVSSLACAHQKLYAGLPHTIQVYSREQN